MKGIFLVAILVLMRACPASEDRDPTEGRDADSGGALADAGVAPPMSGPDGSAPPPAPPEDLDSLPVDPSEPGPDDGFSGPGGLTADGERRSACYATECGDPECRLLRSCCVGNGDCCAEVPGLASRWSISPAARATRRSCLGGRGDHGGALR